MKSDDRISFRAGPLLARIKTASHDAGLPVGEWIRAVICDRLGVEPPEMKAGSAANADTARRALEARWGKK